MRCSGTSIVAYDGKPEQIIRPPESLELPVEDLSNVPPAEREDTAITITTRQAAMAFDLSRSPMLRTRLLRFEPDDHVVVMTMHHIATDAWSIDIMLREVAQLYRARIEGRASGLAPLAAQYVDYAAWQRRWLTGNVLEAQLGYWRARLSGAPRLQLPTRTAPPTARFSRSAPRVRRRSPAGRCPCAASGERQRATLFMTTLAAFKVLLALYSQQVDLCVGTPIANRRHEEVEPLIGLVREHAGAALRPLR